jgi:hypothetical protein
VKRRGSSGPTIGATKRWSSVALIGAGGYFATREIAPRREEGRVP